MIGRVALRLAWLILVIGIYLAGWGWLEYLRHVSLGPTIADALPLYEDARADRVSVAAVFVVWYVTALAALLPWRPRRPLLAGALAVTLVLVGLGAVVGVQLSLVRATVLAVDFGAALHTGLPWVASLATAAAAGTLWQRRMDAGASLTVPHNLEEIGVASRHPAADDAGAESVTSADGDAQITA